MSTPDFSAVQTRVASVSLGDGSCTVGVHNISSQGDVTPGQGDKMSREQENAKRIGEIKTLH